MVAKKFNFLNNSEPQIKEEINEEVKDSPIIDTKVIEYVIHEFPNPSKEISKALLDLQVTLERSIDFIEDKSSEIIKNNRDFDLSSKYRQTSIRLHEISTNLKEYVNWMNTIGDKRQNSESIKGESLNKGVLKESADDRYISIFNDFTGLIPTKFSLKEASVNVENWDDLIMKTASILTSNYKNNKKSDILCPQHNEIIIKKSHENELRDTVIEMLTEYKISLNDYKVVCT